VHDSLGHKIQTKRKGLQTTYTPLKRLLEKKLKEKAKGKPKEEAKDKSKETPSIKTDKATPSSSVPTRLMKRDAAMA
jgi:hypothetical protein